MPKIAELVVDPRFGLLLRSLRKGASLSLRGLSSRTNYSRSFLWDLETGRRHPSLDTAQRLDRSLSANGALIALVSADSVRSVPPGTLDTTGGIRATAPHTHDTTGDNPPAPSTAERP